MINKNCPLCRAGQLQAIGCAARFLAETGSGQAARVGCCKQPPNFGQNIIKIPIGIDTINTTRRNGRFNPIIPPPSIPKFNVSPWSSTYIPKL